MNEKIVTSQAELDAIPVDYNGGLDQCQRQAAGARNRSSGGVCAERLPLHLPRDF